MAVSGGQLSVDELSTRNRDRQPVGQNIWTYPSNSISGVLALPPSYEECIQNAKLNSIRYIPQELPPPYPGPETAHREQRIAVVATSATRQFPPEAASESAVVADAQRRRRNLFVGHLVLACAVFWFCGFLFGFIAFLLAIHGRSKYASSQRNQQKAGRFARASIVVSILGIIAGAVVLIVVLAVVHGRQSSGPCGSSGDFEYGGNCYRFRRPYDASCITERGQRHDDIYCYYNCSSDMYFADQKCYQHMSTFYSPAERCCSSSIDPLFSSSYFDGSACYFICSAYYANGLCFRYRAAQANCANLSRGVREVMYDGDFCYYNCQPGMYFADCGNCYKYMEWVSDASSCRSIFRGVYFNSECYFNCTPGMFSVGGHCYRFYTSAPSRLACVSEFDDAYYDQSSSVCYHNCSNGQYHVDGQCFGYRSLDYAADCSGLYSGRTATSYPYCYHDCQRFQYSISDDQTSSCFNFRTVEYRDAASCSAAFYRPTYFLSPFCYYNCTMYVAGSDCFNYRRLSSSATCVESSFGTSYYYDGTYCFSNVTASICSHRAGASYFVDSYCFKLRRLMEPYLCSTDYLAVEYQITSYVDGYCYYDAVSGQCPDYIVPYRVGNGCFNYLTPSVKNARNCSDSYPFMDTYFNSSTGSCYHN